MVCGLRFTTYEIMNAKQLNKRLLTVSELAYELAARLVDATTDDPGYSSGNRWVDRDFAIEAKRKIGPTLDAAGGLRHWLLMGRFILAQFRISLTSFTR